MSATSPPRATSASTTATPTRSRSRSTLGVGAPVYFRRRAPPSPCPGRQLRRRHRAHPCATIQTGDHAAAPALRHLHRRAWSPGPGPADRCASPSSSCSRHRGRVGASRGRTAPVVVHVRRCLRGGLLLRLDGPEPTALHGAARGRGPQRARAGAGRGGERAVADERLRIAQELHDVVAHSMGVIAVQAGVGAHVIDTDPAEAKKSLEAISATSRVDADRDPPHARRAPRGHRAPTTSPPRPGRPRPASSIDVARGRARGRRATSRAMAPSCRPACRLHGLSHRAGGASRTCSKHAGPARATCPRLRTRRAAHRGARRRAGRERPVRPTAATASSACGSGSACTAAPSTPGRAPAGASASRCGCPYTEAA